MKLLAPMAALLLGLAPAAEAAINPCVVDDMVAAAPTVVQVEDVEVSRSDGRTCRLSGTVVRSFAGGLVVGDRVETTFACGAPDGPGPQFWHAPRELRRAGAVELHLDADRSVAGHSDGLRALPAATDAPARQPNCS